MIRFKTIRYKNFLSTGNTFTEIELDKNTTTLIIGDNGAGKSTMLDALTFSLFGKPFRNINKGQLVNSINTQGTVVECEFTTNNKDFLVRRGIKPNVFTISVDGKPLQQDANNRDFQELLETQILKLNYKSFTQIVVLGNASFKPFMQMKVVDRRNIIEDILDIRIFSSMNYLLKAYIADNKNTINNNSNQRNVNDNHIELKNGHIKQLQQRTEKVIAANREKIRESTREIESLRGIVADTTRDVDSLMNSISDLPTIESDTKKSDEYIRGINRKLSIEMENVSFFEVNDDCPTCKQSIDASFKQQELQKKKDKINQYEQGIRDLESVSTKYSDRMEAIQQIQAIIHDKQSATMQHLNSLDAIEKYIQKVNIELDDLTREDGDIERERTDLVLHETKRVQLEQEREDLLNERALYDVSKSILQDDGIKTRIIKQYLPIINKLVNRYLHEMDFFVSFDLDETFIETIKSRHRDSFTYSSFSEGEKMRIDLALLFTWRAVAKLKNSTNTNLLILDEVFDSSLDTDGTDTFMKIIYEMGETANVFVISHKGDQLYDKFKSIIRFEKKKSFSCLVK